MKSIFPRLPVLLFLFCLTGCQTMHMADLPQDNPPPPEKKPAPRTLPQAVCAYVQSFHEPLPTDDKKDPEKKNDEKKNDAANGADKNKDKDKDKDKGQDKEADKGDEVGLGNRPRSEIVLTRADEPMPPNPAKGNGDKKEAPAEGDKKDDENKDKPKAEKKDPTEEGDKRDEDKDKDKDKEPEATWFSGHAQATIITQVHPAFKAPYNGLNSLPPQSDSATSETGTLFLAARLWESGSSFGDIVFNPEEAGGRGFGGVTGVAGFPNGDITRVGQVEPTPYIARLFYRHTIGFGGAQEKVEDAPNVIAGSQDINRITFTIGKFANTDIIDDNKYSHDPRTRFMNWGLMYNGAWDYPANVRGYSFGMGVEYNQKDWALNYTIMGEPAVANGAEFDSNVFNANGQALEWEGRYKIDDCPGNIRFLGFLNHAHMGNYGEAIAQMPVNPDVTQTRTYRFKYGGGMSWDQEITKDLGVFGRLGWNDGHSETWAFTEIDRTASLGLTLYGTQWRRPKDQIGLGGVINGLSGAHKDYLGDGGYGYIIGDGKINYGPEEILEFYYSCQICKGIFVTGDFQEINHPAYNKDRGPVSVSTLRVHLEF